MGIGIEPKNVKQCWVNNLYVKKNQHNWIIEILSWKKLR